MKTIYLLDFDNTLYDAQSRLADIFKDYNPLKQTNYKFDNNKYLDKFGELDFYHPRFFNLEIVSFIRNKAKSSNDKFIFYSQSPNQLIADKKREMIQRLFNDMFNEINYIPFLLENLQKNKDLEENTFQNIVTDNNHFKYIFIDDAPHRLNMFKKNNWKYIIVKHPYNKNFIYKNIQYFLPNYLK